MSPENAIKDNLGATIFLNSTSSQYIEYAIHAVFFKAI